MACFHTVGGNRAAEQWDAREMCLEHSKHHVCWFEDIGALCRVCVPWHAPLSHAVCMGLHGSSLAHPYGPGR